MTLYSGGAAQIVPTLVDAGVTVLLTDPPHWYRHGWVEREGGGEPFETEIQLDWQRGAEQVADAWLAMMALLIGEAGTAWIFTHPIYLPALGSVVYRLQDRHGVRWPWQYLWVKQDDMALVLLGAKGVLGGYAEALRQILADEPYEPPFQPPRLLDAIVAGSRPDDVFLDPFAGSGRFLQACRRNGRRSIGIELDDTLCASTAQALAETEDRWR